MTFILVLFTALLLAGPATADPATLIIGALASSGVTVSVVGAALIRIGVGIAFSALSAALVSRAANDNRPSGGVRTQTTTAGDQTPQSFILGTYMTAGNLVAPEMAHGIDGDSRYLTRVLDLSDIPCTGIDSLIVDGKQMSLDGATHADYGPTTTFGDYGGFVWCRFQDGSQTSADPMLLSRYGSSPERPWSSDMIGRGVAHVILTFLMPSELDLWSGSPDVKVVVNGIRLYDPRKDSTAGGSGAHRHGTVATHEWSDNPVVMIYNLLRGIALPDGTIYGGGFVAADLPYATWAAAMNACDVVTGPRKTYTAGYEVRIGTPDVGGDSPLDVIDQLLNACSGEIADVGGTVFIRVGGPALPSYFLTDDDILRSAPQDLDPFPASEASYNGVHATFPSPARLWQAFEAPPRYDDAAIAADGQRLIADLALPAVTHGGQAQQLMRAWLKDEMRRRRHSITLPPEGILLNPLDVIDWTSARNGYVGKAFEIAQVGIDPRTLSTTLSIREKNPADYDWVVGDEIAVPGPSVAPVVLAARTVPGWAVAAVSIEDAGGTSRRPALRISWTAPLPGITAIKWQVRVTATAAAVAQGVASADEGQQIIAAGILPATSYQVRGRLVSRRTTIWTAWTSVTTPATFIGAQDFAGGTIPAVDLSGVLDVARFAATLRPVEVLAALPATGNFAGRMVFLTTDSKLYRHTGSPSGAGGFTVAVPAADVTGQLTNAQIADLATAKLTGQITGTQVTDGAISTAKLAAGSVTTAKLVANAVTANEIAAGTITAAEIASGAITTAKLAAGAVTASQLAANAVVAGKIAAGVIGATEIAAGAIVASRIAVADFTNLVPDNKILDPDAWTTGTGGEFSIVTPTTVTGSDSAGMITRLTTTGTGYKYNDSRKFAVEKNHEYWVSYQLRRNSGTQIDAFLQVHWFDKDGVRISYSAVADIGPSLASGLQTRTGSVIAPANAVTANLRPVVAADTTNGQVQVFGPQVRLKAAGELIVDGAIKANHIEANAVTAGAIAANAITAAKIAANTITASRIATGTLVQNLFAGGELQTALYPIGIDFITTSDATWNPRFAGLMQVWVFGAGGGGGGATDQSNQSSASGGGAGGLSIGFIPQATTGQTYALTIGAGGNGGVPATGDNVANGTSGSLSRFTGNGVTFTGNGGGFGRGARNTGVLQAGGTGGTATGGSYTLQGGDGGDCTNTSGNRPAATGGGAPYVRTTATGNASDLVGNDTATGGGRSVPGSIPAATDVSGFMFQGYDSWIGGTGAVATLSNAFGGTGPRACGGGGGACKRAVAGSEKGVGGPGGDGLICVVYYGVGNFV